MTTPMYLGTNLAAIGGTVEMPFLNVLKHGGNFGVGGGSGDASKLQVDANGYPTTMVLSDATTATLIYCLINFGLPLYPGSSTPYPSGNYVLLWDGAGTAALAGDATILVDSHPGRKVHTVAAASFLQLSITATPVTNVRIAYSPDSAAGVGGGTVVGVNGVGTREALLNSGKLFNPDFLDRIRGFTILRFMEWLNVENSITQNWSDRTPPGFYQYTHASGDGGVPQAAAYAVGVPIEMCVALCNELGVDGWFCMQFMASDDYMTQHATLVKNGGGGYAGLNKPLKAYVEFGNELWNAISRPSNAYMISQALTYFPLGDGSTGSCIDFGVMRAIKMADLWAAVWTGADASRLVRMGAGHSGFESGRNDYIRGFTVGINGSTALGLGSNAWTGAAATYWEAFATAPYFGYAVPAALTSDLDLGANQVFKEMKNGGLIPDLSSTHTTVGTSSAYTVTSGSSLPATPANQTILPIKFDNTGTVTISIATQAVITMTGSNKKAGTPFKLTTTGALPGHAPAGSIFYVNFAGLTADAFQFSLTSGGFGTPVNTTGDTQSGTHTLHASNGAKPTMAADGGTQLEIVNSDGADIEAGTLNFANAMVVCATSAIAPTVNLPIAGINKSNSSVVTISLGSPAILTWSAGAPASGCIILSTTGALYTGLTAGVPYYLQPLSPTTFNLTTTPNFGVGALPGSPQTAVPITTTGTQSGVHTAFTPTDLFISTGPATPNSTLVAGASATLSAIGGMTQLNGNTYTVISYTGTNHIFINVDSSGFSSYAGGGLINWNGALPAKWWLAQTQGYATGMVQQWLDAWQANFTGAQSPYNLLLLAYEAGQTFVSGGNPPLQGLYLAINRDPRMFDIYARYFSGMRAINGNQAIVDYTSMGSPSNFGYWGVLENVGQVHSAKYDQLLQLINPNRHGMNLNGGF